MKTQATNTYGYSIENDVLTFSEHVTSVCDNFLENNNSIKKVFGKNITSIGDNFLRYNEVLTIIK